MSRRLEIQGKRFGLLTAVEELPKAGVHRRWRLLCDCGGERVALQKNFTSGGTMKSCGCASRRFSVHGGSKDPEYKHWLNMISRCENPNVPFFDHYGGRGVSICRRWRQSYQHFISDMGRRPSPKHSLDRIDVNGDYEPSNCRWADQTTQCRNTRFNRLVELRGVEMTLAEAVESAPVKYNTVFYRLKRGWPLEEAISRGPQKGIRL